MTRKLTQASTAAAAPLPIERFRLRVVPATIIAMFGVGALYACGSIVCIRMFPELDTDGIRRDEPLYLFLKQVIPFAVIGIALLCMAWCVLRRNWISAVLCALLAWTTGIIAEQMLPGFH